MLIRSYSSRPYSIKLTGKRVVIYFVGALTLIRMYQSLITTNEQFEPMHRVNALNNEFNETLRLDINKNNIIDKEFTKKIHLLLWIPTECLDCAPFGTFGEGNFAVVNENCDYQNCFVTQNRTAKNVQDFDVILFNGRSILSRRNDLPKKRNPKQLYVFVQLESSARYPVFKYDDFFNFTITHRLNSDLPWPYFLIKDVNNNVIAPNVEPNWRKNYEAISEDLKKRYDKKDKLAAWFASNCHSVKNERNDYIKDLSKELKRLLNVSVDIYGKCGTLQCPRSEQDNRCDKLLDDRYLFYMAFENSSEEDYVTEKVYTALNNNVIPVVFGGANYQRFLPPGSYINAGQLKPEKLAEIMINIYNNRTKYYDFFKWKKYYRVTLNIRGFFCRFCEMLNTKQVHKRYQDFHSWWNLKSKLLYSNMQNSRNLLEGKENINKTITLRL